MQESLYANKLLQQIRCSRVCRDDVLPCRTYLRCAIHKVSLRLHVTAAG